VQGDGKAAMWAGAGMADGGHGTGESRRSRGLGESCSRRRFGVGRDDGISRGEGD
jgi:hypothetical protein